jgi:hypothetical protein
MRALRKVGLPEVIAQLPEVSQAPARAQHVDLLIAVLGFEERAASAIEHFRAAGGTATRTAYLRYSTNVTDNQANEPRLLEVLEAVSSEVRVLDADAPELASELDALASDAAGVQKVAVDVSVASNQLILRMLKTLIDSDVELSLLYAEAAEYFPTQAEMSRTLATGDTTPGDDAATLSAGIGQVDVAVEYPGQHLDALPHLVLVFPGFSTERVRAALSAIDPALLAGPSDTTIWLIGRPHLAGDAWRQQALEALHQLTPESRRIAVSTFDYRQSLQELDRVYLEYEGTRRVTLVPMGSKLQAIGASLFCFLHPDVSALFATPARYNAAHYSRGCKDVWRIDFGPTSQLRAALDRVGQLEFEETQD